MDQGTKLFRLADDAGAIYSGHVPAGEESLSRLTKWFQKGKIRDRPSQTASELFRRVYDQHKAASVSPLRILVGVCGSEGPARLLYFDSDENFVAKTLSGVKLLADVGTEEAFHRGLDEVTVEVIRRPVDINPDKATLCLSIALQDFVIAPAIDKAIGGSVQCAIIDSGGFHRRGLTKSNARSSMQISPRSGELKLHHPRERRERRRR